MHPGVAFEQGRTLNTPETVPFRLTRDVVDGMGICGVEGTFRRWAAAPPVPGGRKRVTAPRLPRFALQEPAARFLVAALAIARGSTGKEGEFMQESLSFRHLYPRPVSVSGPAPKQLPSPRPCHRQGRSWRLELAAVASDGRNRVTSIEEAVNTPVHAFQTPYARRGLGTSNAPKYLFTVKEKRQCLHFLRQQR